MTLWESNIFKQIDNGTDFRVNKMRFPLKALDGKSYNGDEFRRSRAYLGVLLVAIYLFDGH